MIPPGGDMFHVLVLALCTNAAGVLFLGLLWRALRSVRLKQARTDLPLSFFDTMTGMPNRHYFQDRISGVLSQGQGGAIVLIDLADFGNVNDRRGRTFGDAVIKELGLRLRVCADNADGLAARLGGDRPHPLEARPPRAVALRLAQLLGAEPEHLRRRVQGRLQDP